MATTINPVRGEFSHADIKKLREKMFPGYGGAKKAAEKMKVSTATWSWYENSKSLSSNVLEKLAKFFKVEIHDLIDESFEAAEILDEEIFFSGSPHAFAIPFFGGVAATTTGQDEFFEDGGYEEFFIPAGVILLEVKGSSMEPLARDGQKIFLRPYDEEARQGDLVVVWTHVRGTDRRLFKRWGGWLRREKDRDSPDDELILVSVNPIETVRLIEHVRRDEVAGCRIVAGVWYG